MRLPVSVIASAANARANTAIAMIIIPMDVRSLPFPPLPEPFNIAWGEERRERKATVKPRFVPVDAESRKEERMSQTARRHLAKREGKLRNFRTPGFLRVRKSLQLSWQLCHDFFVEIEWRLLDPH